MAAQDRSEASAGTSRAVEPPAAERDFTCTRTRDARGQDRGEGGRLKPCLHYPMPSPHRPTCSVTRLAMSVRGAAKPSSEAASTTRTSSVSGASRNRSKTDAAVSRHPFTTLTSLAPARRATSSGRSVGHLSGKSEREIRDKPSESCQARKEYSCSETRCQKSLQSYHHAEAAKLSIRAYLSLHEYRHCRNGCEESRFYFSPVGWRNNQLALIFILWIRRHSKRCSSFDATLVLAQSCSPSSCAGWHFLDASPRTVLCSSRQDFQQAAAT